MKRILLTLCLLLHTQATYAAQTSQDLRNQRLQWLIGWKPNLIKESGKGVLVAVVDSGVSSKIPYLAKRTIPGWSFVRNEAFAEDESDHGTPVAGIITQVAPNARILPVAVTKEGQALSSTVAQGIIFAVRRGASVINVSMNVSEKLLQEVRQQVGVEKFERCVFVISSGNMGLEFQPFQEVWENVLVVGATELNEKADHASYSNYGPGVDIVAPAGSEIDGISTFSTSGELRPFNGTSGAAPVVAGAAALVKEKLPRINGAGVKKILLDNSCAVERLNPFSFKGRILNLSFLMNSGPSCSHLK